MKTLNLFITISFFLIMTSLDGQNIGIATTSPLYRLDIDAITGTTGNPARFLGLMAGATSDSIISSSSGILRRLSISQIIGSGAWSTIGNSGLAAGTNFIGNTDAIDLAFRTNNTERMRILSGGNTGIGTTTPVNLLDVDGGVVIGATYGGTNTAPTNGLLVEGYVGVGTTTANTALDLNGGFSLRPSSVSLTADNQAVTVGNASSIVFTSNSGTATSRLCHVNW